MRRGRTSVALGALLLIGACTSGTTDGSAAHERPAPPAPAVVLEQEPGATAPPPDTSPPVPQPPREPTPATVTADPRPAWLGTRVLPRAADGFGERLPTPPELVDRRLVTPPLPGPPPPPPPEDGGFRATLTAVPPEVAARSTWQEDCPVTLDDLRYLTLTHVGFDGRTHTGELLVHRDVAEDVADVFAALHAARFPIEELRVIRREELDALPTGDGNVTSAFVCRPTVGGTRWSEHAFGLAVDVNPFHNPYVRGDLVLPELASAYTDRGRVRAGMIVAGDAVTAAFAAAGWQWGGDWTGTARDPMHFSTTGR